LPGFLPEGGVFGAELAADEVDFRGFLEFALVFVDLIVLKEGGKEGGREARKS